MDWLNSKHPHTADFIYSAGLWLFLIGGFVVIGVVSIAIGDIRIFIGGICIFVIGWLFLYTLKT